MAKKKKSKEKKQKKTTKQKEKTKKEIKKQEKASSIELEKEQIALAQKPPDAGSKQEKLKKKFYEEELLKLQVELVRLQDWVKHKKLKIVVVLEGRDAAGKGGIIKRITERVSPRVFRVVALPAPSERDKTQLYFQRYIGHLPAGGEIVLFDRSWYNRAGVEHVMGFCTQDEYHKFLGACPIFEDALIRGGIILIKYFLEVSQEEQKRRFLQRINDPLRHWKLSPMDIESYRMWWDYTKAYDRMITATDTAQAPWHIVHSDDKRRARLNCISHLLSKIPYEKIPFETPDLPRRKRKSPKVPVEPRYRNFIPEVF
jgi:polyphosphate kinase 2